MSAVTVPEYKLRVMQLKAKLCQDLINLLEQDLDDKEFKKQASLVKARFDYDNTHQYYVTPREE